MPERALSADDVVRAALDLLDESGLDAFTMRRLAERLGTYPASVYWHVGGKTEVLSAVGAHVLAGVNADLADPTSTPWDEWLAGAARGYRRAMHAHPALAAWAVTHLEARVPVPDVLEQVLFVLARAGFAGDRLASAYTAFMGSLFGWVGVELIPDDPERGADRAALEASISELTAETHPTIVANLGTLENRAVTFRWEGGATNPLDDAFEFALATWIEGLRAQAG